MSLPYEVSGRAVRWSKKFDVSNTVSFEATEIRRERTGVHAVIKVLVNGVGVARSGINLDDGKDVIWLSNKAFERLEEFKTAYPKAAVWKDLDLFCEGLWDRWVETAAPELLEGETDPKPPSFILEPLIIEDGGTILFAAPGAGKSWSTQLMAVSIDSGISLYWPVKKRKVLWVNLERSKQSIRNRLGLINRALGLPANRPLYTLNARGRSLNDVVAPIERAVQEAGVECVFLDSISRSGMGTMVEDQPANRIVDALNGFGVTWLAIGHTPRGDSTHLYGSMMFEAGCDIAVQMLSQAPEEGGDMGVGFKITKENDVGPRPIGIYAMSFTETGLSGFRRAREGEFADIESSRPMSVRQKVINYLLEVGKATATQIAFALDLDRSQVSGELNKGRNSVYVQLGRDGKNVFFGVREKRQGEETTSPEPAPDSFETESIPGFESVQ